MNIIYGGEYQESNEAIASTVAAFPVVLLLIYMILAALLRSYTQPFIVLTSIPLGFAGIVFGVGIFGAALLYGDGMITPAISVLSAVEGIGVATTALKPLVLPLTVGVLFGLFAIQRHGTERVGLAFGQVMLGWFAVLFVLGGH